MVLLTLSRSLKFTLGIVGLLSGYLTWAIYQPDEPLADTVSQTITSRAKGNASDVTIGLMGLNAPSGTDFMAHGRNEISAMRLSGDAITIQPQTPRKTPLLKVKSRDDTECWMYRDGEEVPKEIRENCASPEQIAVYLRDNAELLSRFRQIQQMAFAADGMPSVGGQTIALGKLQVIEIAYDLRNGQIDAAFRKWADNHAFQRRMAGYGGTWVTTAVNLVNEGLSVGALDLLLHKSPQLMETHHDELMSLMRPADLSYYNLTGVLQSQNFLLAGVYTENSFFSLVRMNRLHNRFDLYAQDVIREVSLHPESIASTLTSLHARQRAIRLIDVADPVNARAWQIALDYQIKTGELIQSMIAKEAQRRLYTIKLLLAKSPSGDAEIDAFLRGAQKNLRNPVDGSPFRWIPTKRAISFSSPDGKQTIEVFL